ncbi:Ig-like domain-containing protein [Endozoicomonas sp. G2_2]|uniref:Ig-like domain-containing protein n=1 Tax=Endozoicomonas sp. G2_2 TaxID=2821092 RepID=UPI001ADAE436|nr:Ig-like domain-containing protein [Endozoicomonas sp. G2_2]MBO9469800.1 Ig-like domain-containing protein [Endozoicomonas sp. G2_2]
MTLARAYTARHPRSGRLAVAALLIAAAAVLPACSSGGGGDNGEPNPRDEVTASGLNFTYPFNGQQDVVLDTQMVVNFDGEVSGRTENALELQIDGETAQPQIAVEQDEDQPNILRLTYTGDLQPAQTYSVVATRSLSGGNTAFADGDTLFQFTTRPAEGRPADSDNLEVVSTTPGDTNPVTDRTSIVTTFSTFRVILNEPVDPATVDAESFTVTGDNGPVEGRITALGRYLVFDPIDDLEAGNYTITVAPSVTSQFGKTLTSAYTATRSVIDPGELIKANLELTPSEDNVGDLPANSLNGLAINNVNIDSQLIGSNDQPASASPQRNTVQTELPKSGAQGFGDVIPATIRAGQKIQLTGLRLFLNGDVETSINPSGPIDVNFISDVDVTLMSNDYRNIEAPTAVRLRFDLGIGTLITEAAGTPENIRQSLANGVFNQSALNIQAAGLATPMPNGDLKIATLGTFPINVNRTDNATVDLELTLLLPNEAFEQQDKLVADTIAPIVTAQSPSACLYAFGSPGYTGFYTPTQTNPAPANPTSFPEAFCQATLTGNPPPNGGLGVSVNSFPIDSSPAITFSEPLNPATVTADSIELQDENGERVAATYRVEGFSVVIDPADLLTPDSQYRLVINQIEESRPKDLAGNPVSFENTLGPGQTIAFTTEPQVLTDSTPPLLGTLSPGVPCALEGGNFQTQADGATAGHCVGDDPADGSESTNFPVFENPANVAIDGFFSKFVRTDSIVLADGCLAGNGPPAGNSATATMAVQRMNGTQCEGVVPGELAFGNSTGSSGDLGGNGIYTRSFSFRPSSPFEEGTRYWIVICGTDGTVCTGVNQIQDADGAALNTDPLNGTGSTTASALTPAAGGPSIVMPFDAVAPTQKYYANQFTLPEADTNGNGQFDDGENAQPGNRSIVTILGSDYNSYLSLTRPIIIGDSQDSCQEELSNFATGTLSVETDACIQVELLPGGINSLTSVNIGVSALTNPLTEVLDGASEALGGDTANLADLGLLGSTLGSLGNLADTILTGGQGTGTIGDALAGVGSIVDGILAQAGLDGLLEPVQTGRILLRFPNDSGEDVADGVAQTGYIVEKCRGSIAGLPYDFEPCFVASLSLVANAPDGQGASVDQQSFPANIVGPVTFEQNGRLVISLKNTNTIELEATALGLLPVTATIDPGNLNFQLAGSPTHGGREFPDR